MNFRGQDWTAEEVFEFSMGVRSDEAKRAFLSAAKQMMPTLKEQVQQLEAKIKAHEKRQEKFLNELKEKQISEA